MPTANGSTVILPDGGVELTTGLLNEVGSTFDTQALPTTESFQLHFSYDLRQNDTTPQADGFGFVMQNAAPSAEGTSGGQLGFGGLPGQSVGVLTRSWTNDLLQISTNSDIRASAALAVAPYPTGQLTEATGTEDISYDASTHLLSVTATPAANQGSPVTLSTTIDLAASLGPTAWFGFTGATGTGDSIQTIGAASLQEGTTIITGFPGEPTVPCYAAGTRILTATGERMVESLMQGDIVLTLAGGDLSAQPVRWLGQRRIDLTAHPRPETVAPIRIRSAAFAENMPHSDLLVSPDHAIFVDGKLICARQLINGTTIRQEKSGTSVEYFHVELDAHAILLAEGLPAESYLNTGNRGFFANSDEPLVLHPDLTDETDYPTREAASCAPFVSDEASVRPVWQHLADRAAVLGRPVAQPDTTTEPELRLIVNGRQVWPICRDAGWLIFLLPRGTTEVRLVSRAGSPTDDRPWLDDRRRLGVPVARIVLRGADEVYDMPLDHPGLSAGWWAIEREGMAMRRWTDGEAVLPLPTFNGPAMLEVHIGGEMTYLLEADAKIAPAAERKAA